MTKFKVVRLVEIVQMPTGWKWPGTWREEFREAFEAALNRMAKEGWMYVDKMGWGDADFLSSAMLVFRKDPTPQSDSGGIWITDPPQ